MRPHGTGYCPGVRVKYASFMPGRMTEIIERDKCEPSSKRHRMNVGEFSVAKAVTQGGENQFPKDLFAPFCSKKKKVTLKLHLSSGKGIPFSSVSLLLFSRCINSTII